MPSSDTPRLTLILAAFNEQLRLESVVRSLLEVLGERTVTCEVVIVNDGSRDRTGVIADALTVELAHVRVCHQPHQGLGAAFRTGAALASGEYLMLWPADMLADPGDLEPYLGALGGADVIVGCRRRRIGYNPLMKSSARIYARLVPALFGLRLRDINWIQAYRSSLLSQVTLTQNGAPMLAEALVRLRDLGATFEEVAVDALGQRDETFVRAGPLVMARTLAGLLSFWRQWRRQSKGP